MTEWQSKAYEEKEESMALTRKFLSALGIEADKIDEIITAHTDTVDGLKRERDQYKDDAEAYKKVKKELDDLKSSTDEEGAYKEKYEKTLKEFNDYKKSVSDKEVANKKSSAYKKLLQDVGISATAIDKIIAITKFDDIKLDGDDIKDADKVKDGIKTDWAEFIVKKKQEGAQTETPPSNGGKVKTKDEIRKIKDTQERQKAYREMLQNGDE